MKDLRQVLLGILAALLSLGMVLGSVSMAITEGNILAFIPSLTPSSTASPIPTLLESTLNPSPTLVTLTPGLTPLPTGTATLTLTLLPALPSPTQLSNCPIPAGWSVITVQIGDTLTSIAMAYNTTQELLAQINCLITNTLIPGTTLYVPGQPTNTPSIPCGPPWGWVYYTVQPGDTLSHISQMFGVSVYDLQVANCMGNQTLIRSGQKLFVPNRPTQTWTLTITPTRPAANTPTPTLLYTLTPSLTPTPTSIIILPTFTYTPTPTKTLPPIITNTFTPTLTSTPTSTSTFTPTPSPTDTATFTPSPTELPTFTPTATNTISGTVPLATNP